MKAPLSDLIFQHFGVVLVSKAEGDPPPDPLTLSGFLELEAEAGRELEEATAPELTQAAEELADVAAQAPRSLPLAQFVAVILAGTSLVFGGLAPRILDLSQPITSQRMQGIAQGSIDSWADAGVGGARSLTTGEQSLIDALADNHGLYVSRYFGDTLQERARGVMLRTVAEYGDDAAAIADALAESLPRIAQGAGRYWQPYSVASLNQARNYAGIEQFTRSQFRDLEFYNPLDEKTTAFCKAIAGKRVSVEIALEHVRKVSQASSIEEIESLAPFVSNGAEDGSFTINSPEGAIIFSSGDIDPDFLARVGLLVPPFHHLCRTLLLPV